ncbi:MAG: DUF1841 family protein [Gammaproteobacteria bacterium]|jgi:hypothetical protein
MFSNDRTELRKVFYECWQLKREGQALDALQQMIAGVIEQHPEYHSLLENDTHLDRDFSAVEGETNPFLHMSMHIALIEQISTDRPAGIRKCHRLITQSLGSPHEAEHRMMECLSEAIWQAQQHNRMPDETAYLNCLKNLIEND